MPAAQKLCSRNNDGLQNAKKCDSRQAKRRMDQRRGACSFKSGEPVPKKIMGLNSGRGKTAELRQNLSARDLVKLTGLPRSSFYYSQSHKKPDIYQKERELVQQIYHENKGRYGYRRITLEFRNRGLKTSHKVIQRLMHEEHIVCKVRQQNTTLTKAMSEKQRRIFCGVISALQAPMRNGLRMCPSSVCSEPGFIFRLFLTFMTSL